MMNSACLAAAAAKCDAVDGLADGDKSRDHLAGPPPSSLATRQAERRRRDRRSRRRRGEIETVPATVGALRNASRRSLSARLIRIRGARLDVNAGGDGYGAASWRRPAPRRADHHLRRRRRASRRRCVMATLRRASRSRRPLADMTSGRH